jgi:NADH-quinone oxidoreductase subunit L
LLAAQAEVVHHVPTLVHAVWLIPALPLLALLVLIAFGRRIGEPYAGWVAVAGMVGAFVATVCTWIGLRGLDGEERSYVQQIFTWVSVGSFHVDLSLLVDPLSITMCLFVTFVGSMIFIYAIGYMHGDADFSKFFIYLSFFALSMLVLVTGSSLLVTFLGWEGVGAASYFLIGFWFQDINNSSAAKKAFVVNRVGDWGFMVAMFFAFLAFGSLNYTTMFANLNGVEQTTLSAIAVFVFIGACGKSAQLPLYLWLPDAMAGPTPVSALMHAATMVTAGVYLLVRMNPVLHAADPWVGTLIAIVGAATAFFAATIAISQRDIKKVLAYSTVSQLGYMVLAVGSGAYVAAIFHMITHAFFKALLFLGAGSVIHGMDNEQDMTWYGRLRKFFPITSATFIIAWLAIAGVPPFSGFWSKGEILGFAWHKSPILWFVGVVTALMTAYYMTREVILTFFGQQRWVEAEPAVAGADGHGHDDHHGHATHDAEGNLLPSGPGAPHHVEHGAPVRPHESPKLMTVPLIVLAVGAFALGVLNLPFGDKFHVLEHWLEPSVHLGETTWKIPTGLEWSLEGISIVLGLIGIFGAYLLYQKVTSTREEQLKYEPEILAKAWYYDLGITAFAGGPGRKFFDWVTFWFDRYIIDGAVNGTGRLVRFVAAKTRRLQTGYVRNYALGLAAGATCLLAFVVYRASF